MATRLSTVLKDCPAAEEVEPEVPGENSICPSIFRQAGMAIRARRGLLASAVYGEYRSYGNISLEM
jgi:hypothetical protein